MTETLELCKAEPPATDLETLDILQQTLEKMSDQEDTKRGLWEKAAKAKPQELEIQMRWFTYAFEYDDWKSAQKVCLWVILLSWMGLIYDWVLGCHESSEQFSEIAQVLLLGHLPLPSHRYRLEKHRGREETLWHLGIPHGF